MIVVSCKQLVILRSIANCTPTLLLFPRLFVLRRYPANSRKFKLAHRFRLGLSIDPLAFIAAAPTSTRRAAPHDQQVVTLLAVSLGSHDDMIPNVQLKATRVW
jgi:hypothetical protein